MTNAYPDDYTDLADPGPDDPLGTVRATTDNLAVRGYAPDPEFSGNVVWYVFNIGADIVPLGFDGSAIAGWPVVYQPPPA